MKKKTSLTFKVTLLLFVFVGMVLGLIYMFQTVFLDDFYTKQKTDTLKNISRIVESHMNEPYKEEKYAELSMSNEVCIRIISNSEKYSYTGGCFLKDMDVETINHVAEDAIKNGGEKLFDDFKYVSRFDKRTDDLYLVARYIEKGDSVSLIMVSSIVTPLDVTVKTLKSQYGMIVAIVIVMTALLALLISKLVLKPVKEINNESKKLAKGGYDYLNVDDSSVEFEELNSTLNQANEDIQAADKARKELMANVSHDLRTPLTMIVGYGEMIRDIDEENNEENINVIINEAKRLSALVDDILLVSRMETGQIELHNTRISGKELLENVYRQYEKYCESSNVSLKLNTACDFFFKADKARIEQVLYNFINNALNYNDKDNQEIEIGVKKHENAYRIYVKDNGEGIDEENIDKIWERYYKVDKQHKRSHIGSGIGLSVCKQILMAHDFNYGVNSKKGEFSEFYFDVYEC